MYRADPAMARGEGDSRIKSHFVERVVKLPMVNVAWDFAANTYSHIKDYNKIVNFTLTSAENTALFVAVQAKPVVLKFGKQIEAVDQLACLGLGTLEEKIPIIKKPAEEIINDTRKLYTSTVYSRLEGIRKVGTDTAKSAADFGVKQATSILGERMVQSVITTVDGVLEVTQSYIDHFLPPTEGEKKRKDVADDEESTLNRVKRITKTVRERTYRVAQLKVEYLQEKSIDLFVIYPFTVVETSKANFEASLQYLNKLWAAIINDEPLETKENSEKLSRVEQQLLHLARLVSRQVASTFTAFVPPRSDSQDPSSVLDAARERILWAAGLIKLIPQLLPMYVYGFVQWFEDRKKEIKNGDIPNNVNHHKGGSDDSSENYSDSSIPEEDED